MEYRNARYIDETRINCELKHPTFDWIPYTLDPADTDMTVDNNELLKKMKLADKVVAYVPPTKAEQKAISVAEVRNHRDNLLIIDVDPIAGNTLIWQDLLPEEQASWASYRYELLDLDQLQGFPNLKDIKWPKKPSFVPPDTTKRHLRF